MSAADTPPPPELRLFGAPAGGVDASGDPAPKGSRPADRFGAQHAQTVLAELGRARALVRTLRAALAAAEDGAWARDECQAGYGHWEPVVGLVLQQLDRVRELAIGTADAPPIEWVQPLRLAEVLSAALWGAAGPAGGGDGALTLDAGDLGQMLQVLAEELEVCMGLFEVAAHEHLEGPPAGQASTRLRAASAPATTHQQHAGTTSVQHSVDGPVPHGPADAREAAPRAALAPAYGVPDGVLSARLHLQMCEREAVDQALAIVGRRLTQPAGPSLDIESVMTYARLQLGGLATEHFAAMLLDAQNRLIAFETLFAGSLTQTSVYPGEVARVALLHRAAAVVLMHNHPSGDVRPSAADHTFTATLKHALQLVGVRVLDHVIAGPGGTLSFAVDGLMDGPCAAQPEPSPQEQAKREASRQRQSEAMKLAWQRRRAKASRGVANSTGQGVAQ